MKEKWDQSWRDGSHPELVKSPLYLLSKAIGRISITTPELTKAYMTDPGNRDAMTLFTFNKSEIEKLNRDVISNPEKYEMILMNHTPEDETIIADRKMKKVDFDLGDFKRRETEYWYRFYNNDFCPQDSLPWAQEYYEYKAWADRIEHNAINTLRTAINKILIDHENTEAFDGDQKRLFEKVHDHKVSNKKKAADKGTRLGAPERPLSEIRQSLRRMLQNHPHFNSLFA
jgi:hypothetical protein